MLSVYFFVFVALCDFSNDLLSFVKFRQFLLFFDTMFARLKSSGEDRGSTLALTFAFD